MTKIDLLKRTVFDDRHFGKGRVTTENWFARPIKGFCCTAVTGRKRSWFQCYVQIPFHALRTEKLSNIAPMRLHTASSSNSLAEQRLTVSSAHP